MLKKIALLAASAALVLSATSSIFADNLTTKCFFDPFPAEMKADGQVEVSENGQTVNKSYVLKDSEDACKNAGGKLTPQ